MSIFLLAMHFGFKTTYDFKQLINVTRVYFLITFPIVLAIDHN